MNRWQKALALILLTVPLLANTGAPMVAMTLPMMVLLLIPIVFIESAIVRKMLNLGWKKAFSVMLGANLLTTFVGLPLSNLVSFGIAQLARVAIPNSAFSSHRTVFKATLGSYWFDDHYFSFTNDGKLIRPFPNEPGWYFVLAIAIAFLVNLFVSIYLEYRFMRRRIEAPHSSILQASIRANAASYLFLLGATFLIAIFKR